MAIIQRVDTALRSRGLTPRGPPPLMLRTTTSNPDLDLFDDGDALAMAWMEHFFFFFFFFFLRLR